MDRPTGLVTFLFTDIEGSTKLSQEYPDTLPAALDRHHSILQSVIESNNGFVFEIVGDAFCSSFQNAEDAVKAAVDAQLNLKNEKWEDANIKIRIGIHSGNAEWNGNSYMGYITLARTARIMSSAYGGQIIISANTYDLCFEKLYSYREKSITFRDLGERRLKDVIQPIRLFQTEAVGLLSDFPPLKTLDARPNNIPVQLTSFIGRVDVMQDIKKLIRQNRLVTIIGSGGAGKSRIALQAGADLIDDFSNGVYIAELAPVSDPALIYQTLTNSLGIMEYAGKSLEDNFIVFLKDKNLLLILDNCEHLISECANIAEMLLMKCPGLKIIATSREALNCHGENTYRLPSLQIPDASLSNTPEQLTQYESVRLFIERALSINQNFRVNNDNAPALAEICSRLDGIPLAIELAAARTKILPLEKLCERLDKRFQFLTGGRRTALPRQQTLKAMIDWSFDLLSDKEKILWQRLSVFHGGWSLEAAEDVCSDEKIKQDEIFDLLIQLSDKSIVSYDIEKNRYRILETIKQYGEEKLMEANESEAVVLKHLNYFLTLSETANQNLNGEDAYLWLEIMKENIENFYSAIVWSFKFGDIEKCSRLAVALGEYWVIKGHYSTGKEFLEKILNNTNGLSKLSLAKVLKYSGTFSNSQGNYEDAKTFLEESLNIFREIEDKVSIAETLEEIGMLNYYRGNFEQAKKLIEESLVISRDSGDKTGIAYSLLCLAHLDRHLGNISDAREFLKEALTISRETGDKLKTSICLNGLGIIFRINGEFETAQKYLEEGLSISREFGDKLGITNSLISLGVLANNQKEYEQSLKYLEESLSLSKELGDKRGMANSYINLGDIYVKTENYNQAKKFIEESLALSLEIGNRSGTGYCLMDLGKISDRLGNFEEAEKYLEEAISVNRTLQSKLRLARSLTLLGNLKYTCGNNEAAIKYYEESLILSDNTKDLIAIYLTLSGLSGILCNRNHIDTAAMVLGSASNFLKSNTVNLDRIEKEFVEKILNEIHQKICDDEFNRYFDEGKKLTTAQAIEKINTILNLK